MIQNKSELALAYLESQPHSAVSILEQQPVSKVADFINQVPYKKVTLVFKKMLPQYIARLCKYLDVNVLAGVLSEMDSSLVAAIIRHSDKEITNRIYEQLSDRVKITCNLLLNYSETDVGAWMQTDFFALPDDCTVKDALQRLASTDAGFVSDAVVVVNRNREVVGNINALTLLHLPETSLVRACMQSNPEIISGRVSLVAASKEPAWLHLEIIGVVNKSRQLIGVLRHLDLRNGLEATNTSINKPLDNEIISCIGEAYGTSLMALLNTVNDIINIKRFRG